MLTWSGKAAAIPCLGRMRPGSVGAGDGGRSGYSYGLRADCAARQSATETPVLAFPPHHEGIPLAGHRAEGKILIQLRQGAPWVETRSLATCERAANRGGR